MFLDSYLINCIYMRMSQKFCNNFVCACLSSIYRGTEAVKVTLGTHCWLVILWYWVWWYMEGSCIQCMIWKLMFYEFKLGHKKKNNNCVKGEGAVNHSTWNRWFKKFHLNCKNLDQAMSSLKLLIARSYSKP